MYLKESSLPKHCDMPTINCDPDIAVPLLPNLKLAIVNDHLVHDARFPLPIRGRSGLTQAIVGVVAYLNKAVVTAILISIPSEHLPGSTKYSVQLGQRNSVSCKRADRSVAPRPHSGPACRFREPIFEQALTQFLRFKIPGL